MNKLWPTISLALAATAVAATAAPSDVTRDPNEVVCKRDKRVNSRVPTRVCHTRSEWDAIAEENKRAYAEQRDRPVIETRRDN